LLIVMAAGLKRFLAIGGDQVSSRPATAPVGIDDFHLGWQMQDKAYRKEVLW
jgi:hypothetical protein